MSLGSLDPRRLFLVLLPLTLAFRLWLAWVFPMTGDEAYFVEWGRAPDWGFYDHPPMVGWWLALLLLAGDAEVWLRLPAVLQPAILSLAAAAALTSVCRDVERDRGWWAAVLVLAAPVNVWNVFITTDTPLVYFSVLSGLAWLKAGREDDDPRWYLVSGLLLAGAVLSKYFVALLGFAYLLDVLFVRRRPRAWAGLAIAYACTVPAVALMAWWNAGHCWTNYLFNFVNRHEDGGGVSWQTPLLYAATLAYALTPPGVWWLLRGDPSRHGRRSLVMLSIVPFLLFGLLSLFKTIGLHWLLAFVPFALLWLALALPTASLPRLAVFFVGFALLHAAVVGVSSRLTLESWQKLKIYDGLVLTFDADALLDRMAPYAADHVFASDGYSNAVTLGFNSQRRGGQRFIVLGEGSGHARHDDIQTDFRDLDGRNVALLRKSEPDPAQYRAWFRDVEVRNFDHRGARFWLVLGRGFDYAAYRDDVLAKVRQRYYAIPPWLPVRACYFCDRYFGGQGCRR